MSMAKSGWFLWNLIQPIYPWIPFLHRKVFLFWNIRNRWNAILHDHSHNLHFAIDWRCLHQIYCVKCNLWTGSILIQPKHSEFYHLSMRYFHCFGEWLVWPSNAMVVMSRVSIWTNHSKHILPQVQSHQRYFPFD